eukprot:16309324-Heterocapsa_arctica.AAC.1
MRGSMPMLFSTEKIEQWKSREGSPKIHPEDAALVVVQDLVSECRCFKDEVAPHVTSQEGFQRVCQHRGR